jgi:hypothetical protein
MLAVLAAVIPIGASLYVAISVLVEFAARAHTSRVFARVWDRHNEERARLSQSDPAFNRKAQEIKSRRMMLLEANGLDPMLGTIAEFNKSAVPQPPPTLELRRQWVLIIGSVIGVVLLALDALN